MPKLLYAPLIRKKGDQDKDIDQCLFNNFKFLSIGFSKRDVILQSTILDKLNSASEHSSDDDPFQIISSSQIDKINLNNEPIELPRIRPIHDKI